MTDNLVWQLPYKSKNLYLSKNLQTNEKDIIWIDPDPWCECYFCKCTISCELLNLLLPLQALLLQLPLVLKSWNLHMILELFRKAHQLPIILFSPIQAKLPLVLSNAVGSCGCTAAEWPKDAIPGQNRCDQSNL
jgi:hypothetical protein